MLAVYKALYPDQNQGRFPSIIKLIYYKLIIRAVYGHYRSKILLS